jgi:hypothetical protein
MDQLPQRGPAPNLGAHAPNRPAAAVSAPGSVLVAHNSTQEIVDIAAAAAARGDAAAAAYAPFPAALVQTWRSGWPSADAASELAPRLAAAGWPMLSVVTGRARIGAEICGPGWAPEQVAAACEFGATPGAGQDRWAVFVVACK